jgi:aminomethyltransferase
MPHSTPLHSAHIQANAKMIDFFGWEMPLHYGSQLKEHQNVRQHAGMFDVSHMGIVDITGPDALRVLRRLAANDAAKLKEDGQALYSCMLNKHGGVLDDLIIYRLAQQSYRIVWNASRREINLQWLNKIIQDDQVKITERTDLAMIAVQGPKAIELTKTLWPQDIATQVEQLKPFHALMFDQKWIARTGYTGEDGLELILPSQQAPHLWHELASRTIAPTGLGARDTLRLEAGLNLYGADMDEQTFPQEANLGWTIDWHDEQRDFIGKQALLEKKVQGFKHKLVGIVMEQKGVLRNEQTVFIPDDGQGTITSGSYSPTLGHAIALARVPTSCGATATIERRGDNIPVHIVKPPFVRHGKKIFKKHKENL